MLDYTRIEWADLKNTDKSFSEELVSGLAPSEEEVPIDLNKLVNLPNVLTSNFSPLTIPDKPLRSSILKRKAPPPVDVPVVKLIAPEGESNEDVEATTPANLSVGSPNQQTDMINTPRCRNPLNSTYEFELSPKKTLLTNFTLEAIEESPPETEDETNPCNATFAIGTPNKEGEEKKILFLALC